MLSSRNGAGIMFKLGMMALLLGVNRWCGGAEQPICVHPADQWKPAISGNVVVWQDSRNGGWDIYMYNISTGEELAVCTATGDQWNPCVWDNYVVWQDKRNGNWDIYAYNLTTMQEILVCTDPAPQSRPVVSDDVVVWEDNRDRLTSGTDLHAYNLITGESFIVCDLPGDQLTPDIAGNKVVWEHWMGGQSDIYEYDISTGATRTICDAVGNQSVPNISSEGNVVWTDYRISMSDIYLYDAAQNTEIPLITYEGAQTSPRISGSIVVWSDYRELKWDVHVFDRNQGIDIDLTSHPNHAHNVRISGTMVVWEDYRNGKADIYAFDMMSTLKPYAPLVTDDGAYTASTTELSASWLLPDGSYPASKYECCLGTSTGEADIKPWTDIGLSTSVSFTDLNLDPGQAYYFSVRAQSSAGITGDAGSSDGITVCTLEESPGSAKLNTDGEAIAMNEIVLSAIFPDAVYIEQADRSSGIRIDRATLAGGLSAVDSLAVGDRVDVAGILTIAGGERTIVNAALTSVGSGTPVGPLGMVGTSVGGSDLGELSSGGQQGIAGSQGPNNIGLLIRIWGSVMDLDQANPPSWFVISDESGGAIKIVVPATMSIDPAWTFVTVIGISSCEEMNDGLAAVVRVRDSSDIQVETGQ